jgi:predicted mannosyl-3-phosphoglycerate phosphatase (HAD superfamily)
MRIFYYFCKMNIIFLDIDGVLSNGSKYEWNIDSCLLLDKLCYKHNLKIVITSSRRLNTNKQKLQDIFGYNYITTKIYDYTPILNVDRGLEIELYLIDNKVDNYLILDDNIKDIELYNLKNIVKCNSVKGFTNNEYNQITEIFRQKNPYRKKYEFYN